MNREEKEAMRAEIEARFASELTKQDRIAWDRGDVTEHVRDLLDKFAAIGFTDCGEYGVTLQFREDHALELT